MKVIAFYLPQFHEIPENNEWWGKGFTEWVNVKKAQPLFVGHKQPKVPLDDNYYNLLDDKVKEWQVEIARKNSIYGFCFYHYWFDGKLMLEKPVEQYLNNEALTLPFCICWANPAWTRIWAGEGSKVLIDQHYGGIEQWEEHFLYLLQFFKDSRYIKENNCPLLVIYTPSDIPNLSQMISYYKKRAIEEGFNGIKFAYQYYVDKKTDSFLREIFDYCIKFQPVYAFHQIEEKSNKSFIYKLLRRTNKLVKKLFGLHPADYMLKLRKTDYDTVWKEILQTTPLKKDIPCGFVNWDNTPRRGNSGRVVTGATPEKFELYLRKMKKKINEEYSTDYLFITAWNEWSEGSYLEPDEDDKFAYLNAISKAMNENDSEQ